MAKLYIANTSKQHVDFCYRLIDEKEMRKRAGTNADGELVLEKNYRTEKIAVGAQVLIGGGRISEKDIAVIIDQHEDKGLRDSTKISRLNEYAGLCYRLDKPVELDKIYTLFESNDTHLNDNAEDRRETTAAAIAHNLEMRSHEMNTPLKRTEVETIEDTRGAASVASGFEVLRDGVRSRHNSQRRSKKSPRANA